jgi:hypothetical protein
MFRCCQRLAINKLLTRFRERINGMANADSPGKDARPFEMPNGDFLDKNFRPFGMPFGLYHDSISENFRRAILS